MSTTIEHLGINPGNAIKPCTRCQQLEAELHSCYKRLDACKAGTASQCARAAIKSADEFRNELESTRLVLRTLVEMINEDKDGDFFICKEARSIVEAAMRGARK